MSKLITHALSQHIEHTYVVSWSGSRCDAMCEPYQ